MRFALSIMLASLISLPTAFADTNTLPLAPPVPMEKPVITPIPPTLSAKAYLLIDADSGKVIAEKNSDMRLPPASLTKMMTLYIVSHALQQHQVKLTDEVTVSQNAWHSEGSRMFIKEGSAVSIENLIKGIIVDSGNDACVAIAEHIGGSEAGFAMLMNQQATALGMHASHFTDSTGLPNPDHYTTAKDLAILGRGLIKHFPEYYPWYQQKWFTYNGIRQPNRNRLLWRNGQIDGIKTGHTNEAGFCLVSSAKRNNMRLLAVVMGAPSDNARAEDSEKLLNYGFRFFETHALYQAGQPIQTVRIYKGNQPEITVGAQETVYVTVPSGQFEHLKVSARLPNSLQAPIQQHDKIGELVLSVQQTPLQTYPLYALQQVPAGSLFTRCKDSIKLSFKKWFG